MIEPTEQLPMRYERSIYEITQVKAASPVARADRSGAILLIGSLIALGIALSFVGTGTHLQAVAWAFVVAAVIGALDRWA